MQIANFAHLDGVADNPPPPTHTHATTTKKRTPFYVKILPINVFIINPAIQVVREWNWCKIYVQPPTPKHTPRGWRRGCPIEGRPVSKIFMCPNPVSPQLEHHGSKIYQYSPNNPSSQPHKSLHPKGNLWNNDDKPNWLYTAKTRDSQLLVARKRKP